MEKKVMVFGVFDGLHEGHRHLLRQAKSHGDRLVVAVAQDHIVELLKKRLPKKDLGSRMEALIAENIADEVVAGDYELGSYLVVNEHRPDVIALGYDQDALKEDLEKILTNFDWYMDILKMEPHEPDRYHSSILKNSKS